MKLWITLTIRSSTSPSYRQNVPLVVHHTSKVTSKAPIFCKKIIFLLKKYFFSKWDNSLHEFFKIPLKTNTFLTFLLSIYHTLKWLPKLPWFIKIYKKAPKWLPNGAKWCPNHPPVAAQWRPSTPKETLKPLKLLPCLLNSSMSALKNLFFEVIWSVNCSLIRLKLD